MAARNLSAQEAMDILNGYVTDGLIALEHETLPGRVNLDGVIPYSGGQLQAGNVAGVIVRYWGNSAKGFEHSIQPGAAPGHLDPRNALALVNLCNYLSGTWGITELYHIGIDGSDPSIRNDCHGQGRAVDFSGVRGTYADGSEIYLTVWDDWGKIFVPGLTTPSGDWPDGTGSGTDYRLDYEGSPDGFGREFFRDFYNYVAREWQDREFGWEDDSNPTTIGPDSRVIMHPDHPATAPGTDHGREAHKTHVHMQIGVTGAA